MFRKLLRKPQNIQTIYLYLVLGNTLATSFIWGINTIFLLDAGLSNYEAFLANAFFSLGYVIFEIPTGIIADTFGRRTSYLLGALTLAVSTLWYLLIWQIHGPFWQWALASVLLGLGYTFFSGATEAWLVDALKFSKFKGSLESVFAKGQIVGGAAMLTGALSGGIIAQYSNLGVPYILRAAVLMVNFAMAFVLMQDLGFTPRKVKKPLLEMKNIFLASVDNGLKNPPVRWLMFSAPFISGVSFYIFYALQPFLLELYGNETAYSIAGLVASLVALAQISGGFAAAKIRKLFGKRTTFLLAGTTTSVVILLLVSQVQNFYVAVALTFIWALMFAALSPIRQAYINGIIPSAQRATVLSFDSLMGSTGGIVAQPMLGKVADIYSYSTSYAIAAVFQSLALPFIYLSRREKSPSDKIEN